MTFVKKARRGDLEEIAKILKKIFNEKPYEDGWNDKSALEHVRHEFKIGEIFILKREKEIVGICTVRTHVGPKFKIGEIMDFGILGKYRKKGVGSEFLKEIENGLKERGYLQIYFEVYHRAKAVDFYKKNKYKESPYSYLMIKRLR